MRTGRTGLNPLISKECLVHVIPSKFMRRFIRGYSQTCATTSAPPPQADLLAANHLMNLHVKWGNLDGAHNLFDQMSQRNVVSWTILITAYARRGNIYQCFRLFSGMLSHCRPNDFAYSSFLSVCDYFCGLQVHGLALKTGFDSWIYVANALVAMYWNHGDNPSVEAWRVFDGIDSPNLVTYNSMIAGLGLNYQSGKALALFIKMHHDGIQIDSATLLSLVSSLSGEKESVNSNVGLMCCPQLHCLGIKTSLLLDVRVSTSMIKFYSNLGEPGACHKLFLETNLVDRDIVLWTEFISALTERDPEQALLHFNQMRCERFQLDSYVYSVLLKACSNLVTDKNASAVHSLVIVSGFLNTLELHNVLIHAYARCGSIEHAEKVFYEMQFRDVVSWNSILKAYAAHGNAEAALSFFKQMDVAPDETTFVALLSSCSHAGMVKEGTDIFDTMYQKYGVVPQLDHYACMVDILGRAGHLSDAENIIRKMPMEPDHVIWSALLGACRKHGQTELAGFASSRLKELDPQNSLGYVLLSNMYCSASSYIEGSCIRTKMTRMGVRKEPGLSWTEVGNRVHEFASGGRRHPQLKAILWRMDELLMQLKKIGYVPDTGSVLFDVEEEHKEEHLYLHSEKLALVFSLMNAGNSGCMVADTIRIIKNIRICLDCHNFIRLASEVVGKVIVVRDSNRFHHFKDGACSCNDYW